MSKLQFSNKNQNPYTARTFFSYARLKLKKPENTYFCFKIKTNFKSKIDLAGYAKCRTLKGIPPIVAGLLKQMNQLLKNQKLRIRIDTQLLARVKKVRGLTISDKVRRTLIAGLDKKPIDNNDYVDVLASIFEFRQTLSPVGSNLNQLTRLLNSEPHLFQEVQNIDMLDELKPLLKESIKMLKFIEKELRIR